MFWSRGKCSQDTHYTAYIPYAFCGCTPGGTLGSTSGHSLVLAVRWLRGPSAWGVWGVASRAGGQGRRVVILDAGNHSTVWKRNESHRVHRAVPDVTRLETQAKPVGIAKKVTSDLRIA